MSEHTEAQAEMRRVGQALKAMVYEIAAANDAAGRSQNLQGTDFKCLMYLAEVGVPVSPKDLIAQLGVTSGAVTGLLDRLEGQHYLRRVPHPTDRRSTLVELNPDKAAGFSTVFTRIEAGFSDRTKDMSSHDLGVVADFFDYVTGLARLAKHTIDQEG